MNRTNLRCFGPDGWVSGVKEEEMERSKAEKLSASLDGMVSAKVLPGLLPETVTAAAALIREQEAELVTLRKTLASKHHSVTATAESANYRKTIRAEFVIADPRLYYAEMQVDDLAAYGAPLDWEKHVARQLARTGTADWMREIEEMSYAAVHKALAQGIEAQRAATVKQGAVHESPVREANAP